MKARRVHWKLPTRKSTRTDARKNQRNLYTPLRLGWNPGRFGNVVILDDRGYSLGVVTSGSRWRLVNEVEDFGLSGVFDVVICNEDVAQRKPNPEGLLKALARLRCPAVYGSYVGDVPEDILAGKNAAMHTVGVRSRFPTSRKLPESSPDLHLEKIADLLGHFTARA